ncbi:Oidioi.mRNA.OKI2018_I69.chr2.g4451.t1.cds [Oikopleura dioica]|uniref:Oidioi.mRNA.OKI2018_I69.chr2.g4451.t1.cds n=1 Tax=Oikopleura dioica TaxID=34765 RepID=A0ABN7T174_OIKDI|nr:Oidioi.mRNA.OKI2018_I69.chr2.g4451.t1.cds [Oikopleura dioica]
MKLSFGLLAIFAQAKEETCFHPKLAQFDRVIRGKYKRKFEFEDQARYFSQKYNEMLPVVGNLTIQLHEMEDHYKSCSGMVRRCHEQTNLLPRKIHSCLQERCEQRFGLSTSLSSMRSSGQRRCYEQKCQECKKCDCPVCRTDCITPWMSDWAQQPVLNSDSGDAECIKSEYKKLAEENQKLNEEFQTAIENSWAISQQYEMLMAKYDLGLKHYEEYKEAYNNCFESLEKCDAQLNHLRSQVSSCDENCEIDQKYIRGNGRFKTLVFRIQKFEAANLENLVTCETYKSKCEQCNYSCYCDRCPRCLDTE